MVPLLRNAFYSLFPGICYLCDARSGRPRDLCPACEAELPLLEGACEQCALPLATVPLAEVICGRCVASPPPFVRTVAPYRYTFPVDRMIIDCKFNRQLLPARLLTYRLATEVERRRTRGTPSLLVPVPLHPRRLRERGFNQAEVIARALARELGLPCDPSICQRVRDTPAQSGLAARERRANLRRAFAVGGDLAGATVGIVDDVVTTGTTAVELAHALLAAGAGEVHVLALARRVPGDP